MFSRVPVPHATAKKIQTMILSGALKSGDKVPSQREFAQSLGVSRASLREALLTLETLGLVKTEPGRGTFIANDKLSTSRNAGRWRYSKSYQMLDVFQTRATIEVEIVSLSTAALTDAQIAALEQATDDMEVGWNNGDLLANVDADLEFHRILADACPNQMLVDLYHSVHELLAETQMQPIPMTDPGRMRKSIAEHRRIVTAIRSRNAAKAAGEMRTHIVNTARCAGIVLDGGK